MAKESRVLCSAHGWLHVAFSRERQRRRTEEHSKVRSSHPFNFQPCCSTPKYVGKSLYGIAGLNFGLWPFSLSHLMCCWDSSTSYSQHWVTKRKWLKWYTCGSLPDSPVAPVEMGSCSLGSLVPWHEVKRPNQHTKCSSGCWKMVTVGGLERRAKKCCTLLQKGMVFKNQSGFDELFAGCWPSTPFGP